MQKFLFVFILIGHCYSQSGDPKVYNFAHYITEKNKDKWVYLYRTECLTKCAIKFYENNGYTEKVELKIVNPEISLKGVKWNVEGRYRLFVVFNDDPLTSSFYGASNFAVLEGEEATYTLYLSSLTIHIPWSELTKQLSDITLDVSCYKADGY